MPCVDRTGGEESMPLSMMPPLELVVPPLELVVPPLEVPPLEPVAPLELALASNVMVVPPPLPELELKQPPTTIALPVTTTLPTTRPEFLMVRALPRKSLLA
jgi:hypothetical protein